MSKYVEEYVNEYAYSQARFEIKKCDGDEQKRSSGKKDPRISKNALF